VLLGSIPTGKYASLLVECFDEQMVYPADFVGRGDMSRGGLLLRAVAADQELEYVSLTCTSARTGKRPPKLKPLQSPNSRRRAAN
jgi:hypothetical protein